MAVTWLVEPDRMDTEAGVQVQILGPIGVTESGVEVPLTPQLRRLLGLLVVADGGYVSADRIAEHLADGDVDGSKIRTAVSRLRKVLGDRIETVPGGYRLRLAEDEVDAARFESMRDRARTAASPERVGLSVEALGLWRGAALEGVADEEWATAAAARLESARAVLTEDLADALSDVGRFEEAIELLDTHLVDHPYRERPIALLMWALTGAGRLPDALRAYQRFRVALRDDMGLDPSSELRAVEVELLAASDRDPERSAGGRSHDETDSFRGDRGGHSDEGAPVAVLPAGATVTILFTDIEASTQRWRDDPVSMATALADHDRTLQRVIEARAGRVFKHTGDGVGAVFWSAAHALDAACEAQDLLELPVRIGLHTGEVIERDGDLYGPTLNRCARIADAGHGGQILMSAVTLGVIGDDNVTADVTNLGEHTLKGLASPERIFQFGRDQYPPLRVDHQPSALPTMLTALVGREELVTAVDAAVHNERLVTLLGPGGIGKTSVALTVAERVSNQFDLTIFVGLDEVSGEDDVLPAFSQALRLPSPTMDAVAMALSNRCALIVVDNCEHVVEATADVVEQLLRVSPNCRILATSREGLGVAGEHIVVVKGLGTNDVTDAAVDLFRRRVRASDASVEFGSDDLDVVLEICRRVDGLPLAIELAAARIPMLTPTELLERLTARFEVLTGGRRRRSGDRQKTLRTTVDWSYELLDADDCDAFARLSVFAASFDLSAAAAVLDGRSDVEVLDLLAALADKSLLTVDNIDGVRRYRYLETIRSYAEDRLDETGDTATTMRSLHDHHVGMMQTLVDDMRTRSIKSAADRLNLEIPNVRRTFEHALSVGDVDAAAQLIAPVSEVSGAIDWPINGWAAEALTLPDADSSAFLPHLLTLHGIDQVRNGKHKDVRITTRRAIDAGGGYGLLPASLCRPIVFLLAMSGDEDLAVERTMARLAAPGGFDPTRSVFLTLVMYTHRAFSGRHEEIMDDWPARIEEARRQPWEVVRAEAHYGAAILADIQGDFERMLAEGRSLLDMRVAGSSDWLAALQLVAAAEHRLGHLEAAIRLTDELIDLSHRYSDRNSVHGALQLHALILQTLGEAEAAAKIRARYARKVSGHALARPIVELDQWLDAQLGSEHRHKLRASAATKTPRELQAVAHEAERRHLDLPLEAT